MFIYFVFFAESNKEDQGFVRGTLFQSGEVSIFNPSMALFTVSLFLFQDLSITVIMPASCILCLIQK